MPKQRSAKKKSVARANTVEGQTTVEGTTPEPVRSGPVPRASPVASSSVPAEPVRAAPPRPQTQETRIKHAGNVVQTPVRSSLDIGDIQDKSMLEKELTLGKGLLEKAIKRIDERLLRRLTFSMS